MKKSLAIVISILLVIAIILPASAFSSVSVKGIKLNASNITMKVGQTYSLKATLTPKNATQKTLSFAIANKKIATIDVKGVISGVSAGTTTITVYTSNKKIFAKCKVTVKPKEKPVKITLVTIWGSTSPGHKAVYDKINARLLQTCNATLSVRYLATPETQYPLLFSANEESDLVFACNWWNYADYARKGAYLQLTTDMIKKYMPQNYKNMPAVAWKQALVDKKIFFVPGNDVVPGYGAVVVRGDIRQKYGIPPVTNLDGLEAYMDAVAKNEPNMKAVAGAALEDRTFWYDIKHTDQFLLPVNYLDVNVNKKNSTDIIDVLGSKDFLDYAKLMRKYFEKGYWSSDAMVEQSVGHAKDFADGASGIFIHNLYGCGGRMQNVNNKHPEWKPELVDLTGNSKKLMSIYIASGTAISAQSKHPEIAMQVLDMMMNDKTCYELANYGIEGVHWKRQDGGFSRALNDALPKDKQFSPSDETWCYYNENLRLSDARYPKEATAMEKKWKKEVITPAIQWFNFDKKPVENEAAALDSVFTQYVKPILYGMKPDVEAAIAEANQKCKEAGFDKVKAELKKQLGEFYSNQ